MALIKTPYNLIYNDDGSLCVTLHDDDVPFEGVKSFAVEEGTTNLIADRKDKLWITSSGRGVTMTDLGIDSNGWRKYALSGTWTGGTYPYIVNIGSITFTGGSYYSAQCLIKFSDESKFTNFGGINYVNQPMNNEGNRYHIKYNDYYKFINEGFSYVDTTTQVGYLVFRPLEGQTFDPNKDFIWVKNIQVEQKSFTTSFVNGTRPYGQFKFSKKMDYKNLVLSTWFKINKVNNPYPRIFDQTPDDTNSVDDFGFYYEQITSKFKLKANTIELLSSYISNSDVTNKWWFVVIGFDNDIGFIKLYDENSLFWDTTFTNNINNESVKQYMFKIGDSGTKQRLLNGLISNLFIGDYKDKDGNVIWTDEFIQEIYNAKKPFAVPAKIPII
ncbi:hypothetical protein XO10_00700 [Marinitoga sp. 1135]|uniref:hypothetical protein n=1 Tax=Marinitoga sp. 1135 TaxID=1643333 RepID=UPI001586005C|nr:hypothetical protein [Marinitoga sp. 1135]NUU94836.1 hypothetical protein [Marinitoga sp. 1135]